MTTRIKICGITSPHDAWAAVEAGASELGLIFVPDTPRCLTVEQAREICRLVGGGARLVGVFQNQPVAFINHIIESTDITRVQLHGEEPPDFACRVFLPVIKTFHLDAGFQWSQVTAYHQALGIRLDKILLERPKYLPGAEGFEALQNQPDKLPPVMLAGGLTPDNVGAVVSRWRPFGVDAASGLESRPGVKDPDKLAAFCQTVIRYSHPQGGARQ